MSDLKIPDTFTIRVRRNDAKWIATDGSGSGFGDTARAAIENYAEGLEIGTRTNQRIAASEADERNCN